MTSIYTIGHSTRPIEEFIELLKQHDITQLVDIRTVPGSRHNPQYGQEALEESMPKAGLSYVYMKGLGGLRPKAKVSVSAGWHNESFRNYADYMQTAGFEEGLAKLLEITKGGVTAIMCAEAVPWRCHRSLVSDALLIRRISVCEIIGKGSIHEHKLTTFAVVNGTNIAYPKPVQAEEE